MGSSASLASTTKQNNQAGCMMGTSTKETSDDSGTTSSQPLDASSGPHLKLHHIDVNLSKHTSTTAHNRGA